MVKAVIRANASKFVAQAEEFLESARQNFDAGRYNATSFSAVQSMINANDAFTVYFLEKRASADHRECLKLHVDAAKNISDGSQKTKLKDAINQRSQAGYMADSISKTKAEKLLRHAAQFLIWVKDNISYDG